MRNFEQWLNSFKKSIADYAYYVDFSKVISNIDKIKVELNILNSLIGSKNIETDFENLISKYPETLKCIPILLAVRSLEIPIFDNNKEYNFSFESLNYDIQKYKVFMRKTGLFNLLESNAITNLLDYVAGVETGLDSNGRKNRGGHLMENLVENYIKKAGYKKDVDYFKEMCIHEIEKKWNVNLSAISNQGKAEKRFDFVIKIKNKIYLIETNFYAGGGSKLNETARSYKTLATEIATIDAVDFIWITDGYGWKLAKNNLQETFEIMDMLYNINDLDNDVLKTLE